MAKAYRNKLTGEIISEEQYNSINPPTEQSKQPGFVQSLAQGVVSPFAKIAETGLSAIKGAGNIGQGIVAGLQGNQAEMARQAQQAQTPVNLNLGFLGKYNKPMESAGEAIGTGVNAALMLGGPKVGVKSLTKVPSILKSAGEKVTGLTITASDATKKALQTYQASKPTLIKRVENMLTGNKTAESILSKPITEAETVARRLDPGTEWGLGVNAKRISKEIWEKEISPKLSMFKDKINIKTFFDEVRKDIISENADLARRNQLLKALSSMQDDFKNVSNISIKKLQEYKEGWAKFIPNKAYKGEEIAGALNDVRNSMAQKARETIYEKLGPAIKQAYIDYGNLKTIAKEGLESSKSVDQLSFTRKAWETILDGVITPVSTFGGKVLYKTGQGLEFVGNKGAKIVRDILTQ
jgi:hypothetical protein